MGREFHPHDCGLLNCMPSYCRINFSYNVWQLGNHVEAAERPTSTHFASSPKLLDISSLDYGSGLSNENIFRIKIRPASKGEKLAIERVRDARENLYLGFIWLANVIVLIIIVLFALRDLLILEQLVIYGLILWLVLWITWNFTVVFLYGNSIEVGPEQYPQIYRIVKEAADFLDVAMPTILVLQGNGVFELFVARRFTRRGWIVITSNMVDEFSNKPSSREFMMFVGRQLGHIKAGHFHHWFFKDVIGRAAVFFHAAWWRRCQFTADRIGLLAAGNLYSAEQALIMITVGARLAPSTNFDAIEEQRAKLFESGWSWAKLAFSYYPYMVDRIVQLRKFAVWVGMTSDIAALPIIHNSLRSVPLLIIHGHDRTALQELQILLKSKFPFVAPRVMLDEHGGSLTMPEKFEKVSADMLGAIALVTPDDFGGAFCNEMIKSPRPRQNVVIEIGCVWGKLGRHRLLLLTRGNLELPSDLSGIDAQMFQQSPTECMPALQAFIGSLTRDPKDS
jgi:Zn-dependent protease with chaperone function